MATILLATDGSPSAARAADAAIELARASGWGLRVVSVWSLPASAYGYGYLPVASAPKLEEAARERGREVLAEAVERARAAGVEATSDLREGDAVEAICAAAAECDAELIVLGAHGWGAVKRLVFGSVSTGVLHQAGRPVLVVPSAEA